MDYNSLITTVESAMNRSDLTALIPDFIRAVEEDVNTYLASNPVRKMIKTFSLSATTARIDLPADFLDAIEMTASDGSTDWPLARIGDDETFDYYAKALPPGITYDASKVQQYRITGDTIVLSQTPATALTLTLDCFTMLEAVTENNATNWMMDRHSGVYRFGTLAYACQHVRDKDKYLENRDLFTAQLEMVALAYPERKREIALRSVDAPYSVPRWPVNYG